MSHLEINVTVKKITEKAYLVTAVNEEGKKVEEWIPKSQVSETECLAEGDTGKMAVADWLVKKKGIVCE